MPAPASLRDLVLAAPAVRRAELVRRARPFEPDGFPVPLDRRRLSARALGWSAAAVVLAALALLVWLPIDGAAVGGVAPDRAPAAAAPPEARAAEVQPLPTIARSPSAAAERPPDRPAARARSEPAPDRGADRRPAPTVPPPTSAPTPAGREPAGRAETGAGRRTVPTVLVVSWAADRAEMCIGGWTADLRARAVGPDASRVAAVQATWTDGLEERTVALRRDRGSWWAELRRLPSGREVTVTLEGRTFGGGAVRPATHRLEHRCG